MQAVQALSHLHCPEAILGLYAWCRDVAGNKMTWVKAAAEVASGRSVSMLYLLYVGINSLKDPSSILFLSHLDFELFWAKRDKNHGFRLSKWLFHGMLQHCFMYNASIFIFYLIG